MRGRMVFSPKTLNGAFKLRLAGLGWKSVQVNYATCSDEELIRQTIRTNYEEQCRLIREAGKTPIDSYNQIDFVKESVAVEVQFGKYSFIAYDLFVKHMAFYVSGTIKVGIEILPMKSMQAQMSSGPGYYEWALYNIVRQGRGIPAVPLVLVGVEP